MKNRELKSILLRNGYVHTRSTGSHHIFVKPGCARPVVLYGDNGKEVPVWLVKRVQSQIKQG